MNLPQILFFDFDNTLVDNKTHKIPESAIIALKQVVANGYKIAIASGRSYPLLKLTGVCELLPWSGYCLNNGQVVMDGNENFIHHHTLSHEKILESIDIAKKLGFNLFFSSLGNDFLLEEPNEYVREAHNFFNEPIPNVGTYTNQPIDKILVYAQKGYDYAPFKAIEGLSTFISVSTYADLATIGISKYSAIQELCSALDLPTEYAAFGDSQNDMEMLKGSKLSVAMGNADPKLKEIAMMITDDVDKDGIYNSLVKLGYIKN
jgi:Cof subfamily protein (haloacid dehalogenase superfamily)